MSTGDAGVSASDLVANDPGHEQDSPKVELTLYAVTDTSGVKGTDNPGAPWQTFAQGETVRITFKATNSGTDVLPWAVINVWAPDSSRPFQDSIKDDSQLAPGDERYYSFDWVIPPDAMLGLYGVSASLRDATNFAVLYDTLVPGPGTSWGAGDTAYAQFAVTVDECAANSAHCDAHATCTTHLGASTCACPSGWVGDGFTCADVDECAIDDGGCGPTAQCVNSPGSFACYDTGPGVQLRLYAVSDASGDPNTSVPGVPRATFAPGSTVRVTMRATNTGPAVNPKAVINLLSPANHVAFDRSTVGAGPLSSGGTQYYSFDWNIPVDALLGQYALAASIRSASDFSVLYDTLVPGSNTQWGPGDTVPVVFRVAAGVGLSLYAVTDASGTAGSSAPGVAQSQFAPGQMVRITVGATSAGSALTVRPVLRLWDASGSLAAEQALSSASIAGGSTRFFSFDWLIPLQAAQGGYSMAVDLADAGDGSILDSLGPTPGAVAVRFSLTPGVELGVYAVTDTSGLAGTTTPGRPCARFSPGDTVRVTLRASNSGPPVAPWPFVSVWGPTSLLVFEKTTEAVPALGTGETQYYSYDWSIPADAQTGAYSVSASVRRVSDFETLYDTLVPGPDTGWGAGDTAANVLEVARGVDVSLYSVSDTSGMKNSSAPGASNLGGPDGAGPTFAPGDIVRVTLRVRNSGTPVTPRAVVNLWAPQGTAGRVFDAGIASGAPLAMGQTSYFSFDWEIPAQAPLGAYALSASVRDAANFSTLYDTLTPGPNSGWGPGEVISSVFTVAPLARLTTSSAATGVGTLTWTTAPGADGYRLFIGSRPGALDVVDTGRTAATSFSCEGLPPGPLWAQVATLVGGKWLASGPILFTRDATWNAPELLYPADGDRLVDPSRPFEWGPATLAYSYRLRIGTSPGASDLVDTGPVQVLRRFLPALPRGTALYGRLESELPDRHDERDFVFQLDPAGQDVSNPTQIENALWATAFVRQMAGLDNYPGPYTALANEVAKTGLQTAFCSQFATALLAVVDQMNLTAPSRLLKIGFNPNFYEMHDLVELQDMDTGRWIVLDPTFGLAPRRVSDGAWATAEDVQAATAAKSWSDISYVAVHPLSPAALRSYYVDYPLLYLNVWHPTDQVVWGQGRSVMPYLVPAELSAVRSRWLTVQAPSAVTVRVDGTLRVLTIDGVDQTSRMFQASTVTPEDGSFTLYEVPRFVFPFAR